MTATPITGAALEPPWVADVLGYWFDEVGTRRWFASGKDLDPEIHGRFLVLHRQIASSPEQAATPRSLLAAVIVLDQFSRHLFRHTAQAYAADAAARRLAAMAIEHGFDADMNAAERMFFYMPFQHSENAADQDLSVRLFTSLGNEDWLQYAVAHKALIDRFGRFPHRNAILGRQSTAEEAAMLNDPMGAF
jgi:uncharacterized protein (DUF924 family)